MTNDCLTIDECCIKKRVQAGLRWIRTIVDIAQVTSQAYFK